tara:strand:- start:3371 stop:4033 length:663 start_codon:yes stop_codon:yes gene_type:complete
MIIIFGASGGIGKELFDYYKKNGFKCIGTFNSNNDNNGLINLDISKLSNFESFISTLDLDKNINIINCVGITDLNPLHKSNSNSWKKIIEVNIMGAFNIFRTFLPYMRENNYGKIINFGSIVTEKPVFGSSAYITSKDALKGLSKSVNIENKKNNIKSTIINLGYSELGMIKKVPEKIKKEIIKNSKYNRLCSKSEIIQMVDDILNDKIIEPEINLYAGT